MHYADGKIRFCFIVLHINCSCWCVCLCDRASLYILYSLNLFVSLSFVHSARLCKGQACMHVCIHSLCVALCQYVPQ